MRKFLPAIKKWLNTPVRTAGIGERLTPRYSQGGRDSNDFRFFLYSDYHYIAHPIEQRGAYGPQGQLSVDYRLESFDPKRLPHITLKRMINLLKNNSSAVNQSGQTFRQALTYGYTLEGHPDAVAYIHDVLHRLERRRKSLPLLLGQIADGIFYGGGIYREIILADDRETTLDYVINDPITVKFEYVKDPEYGEVFELIRVNADGTLTRLEGDPTVNYLPLNSDVNSPFGKPYLLAAIFPAVWQLMLLKDIRDVLRTQVSPFMHVKIDTERMLEIAGGDEKVALERSIKSRNDAIEQWANKSADTAVGSGDEVSYEIISGLNRTTFDTDPIVKMLNRDIASGTNTMPVFLGHNEGTTETHADVQWLIQTAFLRSILRETGNALTSDLNLMVTAKGVRGEVYLKLLEMNAIERLREANIFVKEEEALIKLIDHLSKAFADGYITDMQTLIETYEHRRDLIYHRTADS